ncbi:hypothetical protein NPX13_g7484 [Xylaria arbuscula]|uniref:Uncharacterized protein n=1 Tax=Xylaria arbuscula TaxID=114810 RepID=A0A9W8NAJ9_9PEZI|nr:hypothetical protein NPX13_g7484 [Xylaria arbuscula]
MARDPLFWVLVRNYHLLGTNSLVQSPNIDLKAHKSPVIVREINGEYMGGPRTIDNLKLLGEDQNKKHYRHAAHGVAVSQEYADDFPVWVSLERNTNCPDNHLTDLSSKDMFWESGGEENNRRVVQNTISEIQRQVPEVSGHCEEESRITAEEQQTTSAANPLNKMTIAETEDERNNENTPYSLSYELEALVGQPSFHDSERVLQDMHTWTTPHDMPLSPSLESRPVSPSIEIFSEVPPNLERTDNLPDLVDIATIQRNSRALMTTPEPPEMPR